MPSKRQIIEDFLAQVETEFYKTLTSEEYPHYFGGKVQITYTTAPRMVIEIHELGKPGPKRGSKFKRKIGPSKRAIREMQDTEEFYVNRNTDV
jgi:hypothetical protein